MNTQKKIGEIIKERRKELGLNAKDVAEMAGISQAYLSKIENGDRNSVGYEIMEKIKYALNLSYVGIEMEDVGDIVEARISHLGNMLRMYRKKGDIGLLEMQSLLSLIVEIIKE